jgi:hypothetical protein
MERPMIDLNKLSADELRTMILSMQASKAKRISFKVTAPKLDEKTGEMKGTSGAVSLYGLGRFPITLYASQWDALVAALPDLQAFMSANRALLSTKD